MFVYVEYALDRKTAVVDSGDIELFRPRNITDFDPSKEYNVFWKGDETTAGGYYKAKILHMAETKEDMDVFMQKRPRRPLVASENKKKRKAKAQSVHHEKQLQQEARKKQEVKLAAALAETEGETVSRRAYLELEQKLDAAKQELGKARMALKRRVFADASVNTEVPLVAEAAYAELKQKLCKIEQEKDILQAANMTLQKALAAKILSADGKLIYATSADLPISLAPSEPDEDIGYGKLFATVLFCAKGGISQLTSTAFNFFCGAAAGKRTAAAAMEEVQLFGAMTELPTTVQAAPCPDVAMPTVEFMGPSAGPSRETSTETSTETSMGQSVEMSKDLIMEEISIGSAREDGKLYAGCDTWLSKDAWGTMFRASTDSMFCRLAANTFWTVEKMRDRS
ncbi:uncharacterized protein LOC144180121 [Haemaphysalis longicornis]